MLKRISKFLRNQINLMVMNMQKIYFDNNDPGNPFQTSFFQIMIVIVTIQEIQLLQNDQQIRFQHIMLKYNINLLLYSDSNTTSIFIATINIILIAVLFIIAQLRFKSTIFCYYFTHIYTLFLSTPIIMNSIQLVSSDNFVVLGSISLLFQILFKIMQTILLRQYKIIDIELSVQEPFVSFLLYLLQNVIIILKIQEISLGDIFILIKSLLTMFLILSRYNLNKFINLLCLSLEVTLCICSIFNLEWFELFIIMSALIYLIQSINCYRRELVIFQKELTYSKLQLFLRIEQTIKQNKQNQKTDIIMQYFRQSNFTCNQISQLYEKLYKSNKFDYYFIYCYFLFTTNLIQCTIFILQTINQLNQSSPLIKIIQQELEIKIHEASFKQQDLHMVIMQLSQEENFKQYIDDLIQSILLILQKLQKQSHEDTYQKQVFQAIKSESKSIQKLQNFVNNNIDLHKYTFKPYKNSNIILLNFLKQYYIILYSDYQKANQINDMQLELCGWNKSLNQDLIKCTTLISMDLSNYDGYFYKLNSNRLKQFMNVQLCPIQIDQILPPYLRKIHQIKLQEFKSDGQLRKGELQSYYYSEGFIYPGKLQLQYRVQDNMFLADLLLTKIKNSKDVIMFDSTGKLLGISQQLFKYLSKKDPIMNEINVYKFIELAYIQFYIPSILENIQQLLINLQQGKQTYSFQDRWSFPVNHSQCLQMTQRSQQSKSLIQFSQRSIRDFHKTKQLIKSSSKLKSFMLNPEFQNIYKIEMLQQENFLELNQLIIPGATVKSLQLEYEIQFQQLKYQNETFNYFYFYVNKLEDFQQSLEENMIVQSDEQKYILTDEDQSSRFLMEELINNNAILKPIKKLILAELIFVSFLFICVMINVQVNKNLILDKESSINFLIFPQALTFAYCSTYLLQWNRYSTINQLFNSTPYIESQRQAKLAYAYNLWKGVDLKYTIGLDEYGIKNNKETLVMTRIQNGSLIYTEIRIFEFYQVYREQMHQMYKENNLSNVDQQNYNILKADGFIRLNLFQILRYHDFVMNGIIDRQSEEIFLAVSYIKIFLFSELIIVSLSIVLQGYLIFVINSIISVPIQFLSYMDNNYILERELPLKTFKINQSFFFESYLLPSVENRDDQQMDSKLLLINDARNKAIKLNNFKIGQFLDTLIPILKILILTIIFLVVYYVSLSYFEQYKQSLILTLQYIRFKKLFDSSLIVGELIKTEHLIQDNPIQYINQTDSIELFFHYTDQIQPEFNKIIDQLISASFFNSTMKDKVLKIFSQNLCNYFAYLLAFCDTKKIKLSYNESDSYIGLVEQGISGVIQTYIKLVQSEFTYEKSTSQYDFNRTKQLIYLQAQIHQNIFVQYFQDIQSCFFMCFSYFITETQKYGAIVMRDIELLYLLLGIVLLLIIFIASMIWIYFKQKQFETLKYALIILPSSVIQKESLKKQLINYKNKLY